MLLVSQRYAPLLPGPSEAGIHHHNTSLLLLEAFLFCGTPNLILGLTPASYPPQPGSACSGQDSPNVMRCAPPSPNLDVCRGAAPMHHLELGRICLDQSVKTAPVLGT